MKLVVIAPSSYAPLAMLQGVDYIASNDLAVLSEAAPDADVILVAPRSAALLRELWSEATRVRWVHALAAGVEDLLFDELRASDVVVTNGRGIFADALAEFVLAAMLHFAKDVPRMLRNRDARAWAPFTVERLEGKTAGIVGYGSIGRAVGARCTALGMKIVSIRRGEGSLHELLRESDTIVIATPLTPKTRHLIGRRELELMKPTAILINVGRGAVVDEPALVDALLNHRIRGAALDVFETEPLPPDHLLWSLENVLISPHCADHTADAHERAMRFFIENLARFRRGEPLENVVDKRAGY